MVTQEQAAAKAAKPKAAKPKAAKPAAPKPSAPATVPAAGGQPDTAEAATGGTSTASTPAEEGNPGAGDLASSVPDETLTASIQAGAERDALDRTYGVLVVVGPREGRRRAGRAFGREPTAISRAELDDDSLAAIMGDPYLQCSVVLPDQADA